MQLWGREWELRSADGKKEPFFAVTHPPQRSSNKPNTILTCFLGTDIASPPLEIPYSDCALLVFRWSMGRTTSVKYSHLNSKHRSAGALLAYWTAKFSPSELLAQVWSRTWWHRPCGSASKAADWPKGFPVWLSCLTLAKHNSTKASEGCSQLPRGDWGSQQDKELSLPSYLYPAGA